MNKIRFVFKSISVMVIECDRKYWENSVILIPLEFRVIFGWFTYNINWMRIYGI